MDGIALLVEARAAGLKVWTTEGRLVVRGPRKLEPLALKLLGAKAEVVAALLKGQPVRPVKPCYACAGRNFWRHVRGCRYVCTRCHPAPLPESVAEQLVLAETISPELTELLKPFEVEPCDQMDELAAYRFRRAELHGYWGYEGTN